MSDPYYPKRGDIVWLTFTPQVGHEQAGHRPALILSPALYNKKVGLALVCPITTQVKGYPFEVSIPEGLEVRGVVLADQVKSLDWKARRARFCCTVPADTIAEVLRKLAPLIVESTIL
jgi:mRNA interferase MazF